MPSDIILVVDDEQIITQTVVLILNSFKGEFLAIGSTSLGEAMTIVRGIHPDLVLLDVIMPGADGLQHALEMRDRWGCKVLMISGQGATSQLLEDVAKAGHQPFEIIAKPVLPLELVAKIRAMLNHVQ